MKKVITYIIRDHPITYGVVLAVADLLISPPAQAEYHPERAKRIAANFVASGVSTLIVSQRYDGSYYVVNGQHRVAALRMLGITQVVCEVHHGMTEDEEATLFLIANRESRKPSALDEFTVGETARIPLFVETRAVLNNHGLDLGKQTQNSVIGAVSAIMRIVSAYDYVSLDRALGILCEAWGHHKDTWDQNLMIGLSRFLFIHRSAVDDVTLAIKLQKTGNAASFIGRIRQTKDLTKSSGSSAAYALMLSTWNSRKSSRRLPAEPPKSGLNAKYQVEGAPRNRPPLQ